MNDIKLLPHGYFIENNAIWEEGDCGERIAVAFFTKGPVARFNRERREDFAEAMNDPQTKLARLQEQLRVAREALVDAKKSITAWCDTALHFAKSEGSADYTDDIKRIDAALEQMDKGL